MFSSFGKFFHSCNLGVIGFIVLLSGTKVFAGSVEKQIPVSQKSWQSVKLALVQRSSKVKQCFLQGYRSHYDDGQTRKEHYKNWQSLLGPDAVPAPLDSNKVELFSWFTDSDKWRLDIKRAYPYVGKDFKQISFDGEKFVSFDEYYDAGRVSAARSKAIELNTFGENDLTSFSQDSIFGGGLLSVLETYFPKNGTPVYEKSETINSLDCDKYKFKFLKEGSKWNVQIWFAAKQSCIAKIKQEVVPATGGVSTNNYLVASDFRIQSGVYIPFRVKTELYLVVNNKTRWGNTTLFQVDQMQINDRNSVSAFQHPIRIGTMVTDQLNNPGPFEPLGGDTSDQIKKVRFGTPPKLEELSVIADGAAPDVVAAQTRYEIPPSGSKSMPSVQ